MLKQVSVDTSSIIEELFTYKKGLLLWATLHKEVMPEKGRIFPSFCVKNARNTQSIPALFALIDDNLQPFQVLCSFEVVTFLINK